MPDFELNDVKHYKSSKVSLKNFKGKWLFLDFWFTGCTVCIKSFSKTNGMQEELGNDVLFFLVGDNREIAQGKGIEKLYEKLRVKQNLKFPIAFDSILVKRWQIWSMPYIIVIDPSGIVRVITDGRDMTAEKIRLVIQGKDVSFYPANLERPSFVVNSLDTSESLVFRSVLSKWKGERQMVPEVNGYLNANQKQAYSASGIWLEALYKMAFFGRSSWFPHEDIYQTNYLGVYLDGVDSSLFKPDFFTFHGIYNYDLIMPESQRNVHAVMKKMQNDLADAFGYTARIEGRKVPVWLLVSTKGAEEKLRTKSEVYYTDWEGGGSGAGGFKLKHATTNELLTLIMQYIDDQRIPFFDATGIKCKIDIDMDADLTNLDDIRRVLQKHKLDLIKGEREMNVIVIREKYSDSAKIND